MVVPKTVPDRSKLLDWSEAEQVLLDVQPLLGRIRRRVALRARMAAEIEVLQLLSDTALRHGAELDELVDKTVAYHRLGGQIDAMTDRLAALGVAIRNRDACWVDFNCLRPDGVAVYCWQSGEPHISHWHFLHEDHAARRPLEPSAS